MPRAVWKFPMLSPIRGDTRIEMLAGSKVIGFGIQTHPETAETRFCIWAEVDLEKIETRDRVFRVVPTGSPWDNEEWKRIKFQLDRTGHVWNLLENRSVPVRSRDERA